MARLRSWCTRPRSAASRSPVAWARIRRIQWFPPYHPSWNSHGCRAVRHVFRHHGPGPGPRALAKFDRSDEHRVHADERAVANLGPVLVGAVEIGRNRTRADVGVLAQVGVAEVGNVRHAAAPADLRADELDEAADVDVLADHAAGSKLGERTAVGAVGDPRVLYVDVRSDAALGADVSVALEHGERLDHRV